MSVWFCELAPIDRASVEIFIAETIGVEERVGTDLLTRITDALRHEQGVIVLDNCEHVIDEAAAVAQAVLRECPELRVLATSRERLAVDGEHLRPVAPFPLTESPSADDAAIRLFSERATAVRPDFVLDADHLVDRRPDLPPTGRVCRSPSSWRQHGCTRSNCPTSPPASISDSGC